jgi:hypothetical protein
MDSPQTRRSSLARLSLHPWLVLLAGCSAGDGAATGVASPVAPSNVAACFDTARPVGGLAFVGDPSSWSGRFAEQLPDCKRPPTALAPCAAGIAPRELSEVLASGDALSGQTVFVRGPLGVGPPGVTGNPMVNPSCSRVSRIRAPVVLGTSSGTLTLDGFSCSGAGALRPLDDQGVHCAHDMWAASCCNAPAYGQVVVATGHLEPAPASWLDTCGKWKLVGASLCSPQ